jgi:hypothetical protein
MKKQQQAHVKKSKKKSKKLQKMQSSVQHENDFALHIAHQKDTCLVLSFFAAKNAKIKKIHVRF